LPGNSKKTNDCYVSDAEMSKYLIDKKLCLSLKKDLKEAQQGKYKVVC
jgi:hypothetical protein